VSACEQLDCPTSNVGLSVIKRATNKSVYWYKLGLHEPEVALYHTPSQPAALSLVIHHGRKDAWLLMVAVVMAA
jgi:hypothetical protein